jgi:hypothetical protein
MSTVAPYDTLQLIATPQNAFGQPLVGSVLDSVHTVFQLVDPSDTSLTVSTSGLVQARYPTQSVLVAVQTSLQGITRVDTLSFKITAEAHPPHLDSLLLQVTPNDTFPMGGDPLGAVWTLNASALDADSQIISDVPIAFRSADTMNISVDALGSIQSVNGGWRTGPIVLYAATTVYGVTKVDSVVLTVIPPRFGTISIKFRTPRESTTPVAYFDPPLDTVSVGAIVVWSYNASAGDLPVDVTFDDPTAVEASIFELLYCGTSRSGNIPAFAGPDSTATCFLDQIGWKSRQFPEPGIYHYHSALHGTSGTIVVMP